MTTYRPTHHWASPTRTIPTALVVVLLVLLAAGFLLAIDVGRGLMCEWHAQSPPAYCADGAYAEEAP